MILSSKLSSMKLYSMHIHRELVSSENRYNISNIPFNSVLRLDKIYTQIAINFIAFLYYQRDFISPIGKIDEDTPLMG